MAGNRKKAEQKLFEMIEKLAPGSPNTQMYRDKVGAMTDAQFHQWIQELKSGESFLVIQEENLPAKHIISVERNFKLAQEWGHEFFQRVWMDGKNGAPAYLSNERYLIVKLPLRRLAQILKKKRSIPEHNRSVDLLSGQPTGASKGSKISYPEAQVLQARNLPYTSTELMKYRGGDTIGFLAMNDAISKTGSVSIEQLNKLGTETKSNVTLRTMLTCMHLKVSGLAEKA